MLNENVIQEVRLIDEARHQLIEQISEFESRLFIMKEKLNSMEILEAKLLKNIKYNV